MQQVIKIIVMVLFILICVALTFLVLMQEGKSAGLGALSGSTDTYWSKNKKHSKDAVIKKVTAVLGVLFMVVAILLGSKWFR